MKKPKFKLKDRVRLSGGSLGTVVEVRHTETEVYYVVAWDSVRLLPIAEDLLRKAEK